MAGASLGIGVNYRSGRRTPSLTRITRVRPHPILGRSAARRGDPCGRPRLPRRPGDGTGQARPLQAEEPQGIEMGLLLDLFLILVPASCHLSSHPGQERGFVAT